MDRGHMSKNKSAVLKHLVSGPIEVMTRLKDFNIQQVTGPEGKNIEIPADTLLTFTAQSFRELGESSGEWEFMTLMQTQGGPVKAYIYIAAEDIFLIRAMSRVS